MTFKYKLFNIDYTNIKTKNMNLKYQTKKRLIRTCEKLLSDYAQLEQEKKVLEAKCSVLNMMLPNSISSDKLNLLSERIKNSSLSNRTKNALHFGEIYFLYELTISTSEELLNIRNFGPSCLQELQTFLSSKELSLRKE